MPPHVDSSHSNNEWRKSSDINNGEINALCGVCLDSPLFRDEVDEPLKPLSPLEREQSNPELAAAESRDDLITLETGVATAPFISKIESIIGPESRYYSNNSGTQPPAQKAVVAAPRPYNAAVQSNPPAKVADAVQPTPATLPTQALARARPSEVQVHTSEDTAATKSSSRRPLMLRMTHAMSKKSWRLVCYIGDRGRRFMSLVVRSTDPAGGACDA